jgi:pimeloyl-ACP methyl ester carboxylesterase
MHIRSIQFPGPFSCTVTESKSPNTQNRRFWSNTLPLVKERRLSCCKAYSRPEHAGGLGLLRFLPTSARDFAQLAQTKLTMPVLVIGGEKSLVEVLGQQMKLVASDVTAVVLKDTGHWVMEERQKETNDALMRFL